MTEEQIFQITVLRQKGWPIKPAYVHTVEIRPHPPVTFEGQCLALESDFHPDVWKEILRRSNVLKVEPYVEPEKREPEPGIVSAADEARRAIDSGSSKKPLPITQTPTPPPPFLHKADPIRLPEMSKEAKERELRAMIEVPAPQGHDAISGQPIGSEPEPKEDEEEPEPTAEPQEPGEAICANPACAQGEDGGPRSLTAKQFAQGNKYCCRECFQEHRAAQEAEAE